VQEHHFEKQVEKEEQDKEQEKSILNTVSLDHNINPTQLERCRDWSDATDRVVSTDVTSAPSDQEGSIPLIDSVHSAFRCVAISCARTCLRPFGSVSEIYQDWAV
jgi:hypothetical protein